jgi:hypothetical protein
MLLASGVLSNSCEKVGETVTDQSGAAFKITILTKKMAGANCQMGEFPFTQAINLDIQGLEPGKYPVIVNGISSSIEVSLLPPPTATPTPAPTDTPIAESKAEQEGTTDPQSPAAQPPAIADTGNTQPAENPASQTGEQGSAPSPSAEDQSAVTQPDQGENQADCIDKAAFYEDVTIPDNTLFQAGEEFIKTWKIRNEGTCTWGSGYTLVFGGGDQMDGALSNPIQLVPPQETANISIRLKAPMRGGQQTGNWEFQNASGKRFGVGSGGFDYIWVQIIVDWGLPKEQPVQNPATPAPADPSQAASSGNPPCPASEDPGFDREVLALINNIRVNASLNPVSLQSQLDNAALEHSYDMACNNFADHDGSDGSTWYDRVGKQGYANYASAKEIIY